MGLLLPGAGQDVDRRVHGWLLQDHFVVACDANGLWKERHERIPAGASRQGLKGEGYQQSVMQLKPIAASSQNLNLDLAQEGRGKPALGGRGE